MEYNPLQCNIRVWNQGLGAQCNCQKLENETMCQMHLSKTKNRLGGSIFSEVTQQTNLETPNLECVDEFPKIYNVNA